MKMPPAIFVLWGQNCTEFINPIRLPGEGAGGVAKEERFVSEAIRGVCSSDDGEIMDGPLWFYLLSKVLRARGVWK
jgi:hypothetical protein